MAFRRPSFSPSIERAPNHNTTENPLRVVVLRLGSVAGFAEPALSVLRLLRLVGTDGKFQGIEGRSRECYPPGKPRCFQTPPTKGAL